MEFSAFPFLHLQTKEPAAPQPIANAHVLLHLGDAVTTDHISPAGSISRSSAAAKYLTHRGWVPHGPPARVSVREPRLYRASRTASLRALGEEI